MVAELNRGSRPQSITHGKKIPTRAGPAGHWRELVATRRHTLRLVRPDAVREEASAAIARGIAAVTTVAVEQQAIQFGSYQGQSGPHVIRLDGPAGLYFLRGRNEVQPRLGSNGSGKTTFGGRCAGRRWTRWTSLSV